MHDLDFHGISALLAACYPWVGSRELGRTRGWPSPFCWMGRSVQDIDELLGPALPVIKMPVKSCKSSTISHVRIWGGLQDDERTHKRGKWPSFVPSALWLEVLKQNRQVTGDTWCWQLWLQSPWWNVPASCQEFLLWWHFGVMVT